jgi:ElaB/YqjD/DUF883 family membrane-anchored ribosome-binding protein
MSTGNPRNMGQNDRGVIEAVKDKSQAMSSSVADAAKTVKDKVRDGAGAIAETAEKAWDGARDFAGDVGSNVAERAETLYADSVIFIRRNPVACVLGALGLGLVLGMIMIPRR